MAGVRLRQDLRQLVQADARLRAFARAGGDTAPLMDEIGGSLETSARHRFETETDPDGARWVRSIRAWFHGGQTLSDSGRLANSITHAFDRRRTEIGTNVIYAGIHQAGGIIRAKTAKALRFEVLGELVQVKAVRMPKRAFLGIDADDRTEIGAIVDDFFTRPLAEARA